MYPDLPKNRCYINGKDMSTNYGLILIDGYKLNPPETKEHKVDIPGRNGSIDLINELLGDAVYQNATHELEFIHVNPSLDIEYIRTEIKNRLDGRTFDYSFSFDPEYTYRGKWIVEEVSNETYSFPDNLVTVKVKIDAQPFKHKKTQSFDINAVGGLIINFDSGRERVQPTFVCECETVVDWDGAEYVFPIGTHVSSDITFTKGQNELYISTYEIEKLTWEEISEHPSKCSWDIFGTRRFFEWQNTIFPSKSEFEKKDWTYAWAKWNDTALNPWDSFSDQTWNDWQYKKEITDDIPNVKISYEWGDL